MIKSGIAIEGVAPRGQQVPVCAMDIAHDDGDWAIADHEKESEPNEISVTLLAVHAQKPKVQNVEGRCGFWS